MQTTLREETDYLKAIGQRIRLDIDSINNSVKESNKRFEIDLKSKSKKFFRKMLLIELSIISLISLGLILILIFLF